MKDHYVSLMLQVERLHRRFLDVVKAELDALGIEDINNVQTLILYNIGEGQLTVGELTARGYYLGSNVSYNIKKLVDCEYILQERSEHDKRSVKVRLSQKGTDLCKKIGEMYTKHMEMLKSKGMEQSSIMQLGDSLSRIEEFWSTWIQNRRGY
jgi:DNA-binding MarR family transcriptional regulator